MVLWFGVAIGGEIDVFGKPTAEEKVKESSCVRSGLVGDWCEAADVE